MNPEISKSARSESLAFYTFIVTVILAPLVFWPSPYIAVDVVKTIIIVLGTLISAICCGVVLMNERKIILPSKSISWTSLLLVVSLLVSAVTSIHFMKSFLGQGFEIGTASFMIILLVSALVAFTLTLRRGERAILFYMAMVSAYLVLFIFHILRLVFGANFASLSILNSLSDTVLGSWTSFGIYSALVALISICALMFLSLSRAMKISYTVLTILGAIGIFLVGNSSIWFILALIFLGFTMIITLSRPKSGQGFFGSLRHNLAWLPLILFIVAAIMTSRENIWSPPLINKLQVQSNELSLPWQLTLDVVAGSIKNYPIFGVGPNHFSQAYLAYKPAGVNQGDGWGVEFGTGFGLLPTFVATQGLVGSVLWLLFLVFIGIAGTSALRRLPSDPGQRFTIISSFSAAVLLWLSVIFFVPSHAIVFLTFVLTGIFFGSAISFGLSRPLVWSPAVGSRSFKVLPSFLVLCVVVATVWGLVYLKKTVALAYFGSGIKQLTVANKPTVADAYFAKALSFDSADVYWQARAEANIALANQLASSVNAQTSSSTAQSVLSQIVSAMNTGLGDAKNAIAYDPSNYYNLVSEARVSEAATNYQMQNAYDNAVQSYSKAIALNPYNPSLYLSLARLQAGQNKLDDALTTIGATLQVKNNYLDAIFLLSQVDAAKGNLPEAVTAAQYAIQINPNSALLYFQLGLLQYNSKNYTASADALTKALALQRGYANAQYFLGLAESRLGNNNDAITQFSELAKSNPDSKEVALILQNLQAGRPIFQDAVAPVTPNPEKRVTLPIKQKQQ